LLSGRLSASIRDREEEVPVDDELQQRVTELEIRFTHQAQLLEELSDELVSCHQQIARLEREQRAVRETLKGLGPELTESPDE
jgi:SlyX protein